MCIKIIRRINYKYLRNSDSYGTCGTPIGFSQFNVVALEKYKSLDKKIVAGIN